MLELARTLVVDHLPVIAGAHDESSGALLSFHERRQGLSQIGDARGHLELLSTACASVSRFAYSSPML